MNIFLPRDVVRLKNDGRDEPPGLQRGWVYTVQLVISDRVQINGQLYFASRFEPYPLHLLGDLAPCQ